MAEPTRHTQAQRLMAEANARVDELLRSMPEAPPTIADVLHDLTDEQRAELAQNKDDAIAEVESELTPLKLSLSTITARSVALREEFQSLDVMKGFERAKEISEWFNAHDDEVGLLKTRIRELETVRAFLGTLPSPST